MQIVNVCCMLHNWCIKYNIALEEELFYQEDDDNTQHDEISYSNNNLLTAGQRIRDNIKNAL